MYEVQAAVEVVKHLRGPETPICLSLSPGGYWRLLEIFRLYRPFA